MAGKCEAFAPNYPATSNYVTAVGGTDGAEGASLSGGGFSTYIARPKWQKEEVASYLSSGVQLPAASWWNITGKSGLRGSDGRATPDVAAPCKNFPLVVNGVNYLADGTSASAPVVAGVLALLNDARVGSGKPKLGFANPWLYQHQDGFTDITSGSNPGKGDSSCGFSSTCPGFFATKGWDPVTGLGIPQFHKLKVAALTGTSTEVLASTARDVMQQSDVVMELSRSIPTRVNSNPSSMWRAAENIFAHGHLESLVGVVLDDPRQASVPDLTSLFAANASIPSSFDARQKWPKCSVIGAVRNQGSCGSCWAFGATEAFEDRWCIATGEDILMSPEHLLSCDDSAHSIDPSQGCQGGSLLSAWLFMENQGMVTEQCQPYDIPTCAADQQPCMDFKPTPTCRELCYGNASSTKKYYAESLTQPKGIEHTQLEIMSNGPIEVAFTVYEDFVHYKSGIYHHITGKALGGHAVKLIGWGEENGTPFWLAVNSWTDQWGDGGLFKIKRGTNECGIEAPGLAARAKVEASARVMI